MELCAHGLATSTINLLDPARADANDAGTTGNLNAGLSASELTTFNTVSPNRFTTRHARSKRGAEMYWVSIRRSRFGSPSSS